MRLRRSTTYVKALDPEKVRKVLEGPTDCVLFDLEDGVAPALKPAARRETVRMLKELDFHGKERVVRINAVDTEYYPLDIEEVIAAGIPDSVRVPKCDTLADVLKVDRDLREIEKKLGLDENTIRIWAMVETPLGIRNTYDIGICCERVEVLTIGMQDLHLSMGIPRTYINNELDLLYARQKFVLDAKAAGCQALDTVLLTDNKEINEEYTLRSRRMGFDGRAVHNVEEAAYANRVYYPAPDQFAWAHKVVETYETNEQNGIAETIVDGKVICAAVYKEAMDLLAIETGELR